MSMFIEALYTFPIKSMRGVEQLETVATEKGLQFDRNWMLVDENYKFLTLRELPELAIFDCIEEESDFIYFNPAEKDNKVFIPKNSSEKNNYKRLKVWESEIDACEVSAHISAWFSDQLQKKVILMTTGKQSIRKQFAENINKDIPLNFADKYPYLVLSTASVSSLNSRLSATVSFHNFRPNILISGMSPHEEDRIAGFNINGTPFRMIKECSRCQVVNVDQFTGSIDKEPLTILNKFRRRGNRIDFGMHAMVETKTRIRQGDIVSVF